MIKKNCNIVSELLPQNAVGSVPFARCCKGAEQADAARNAVGFPAILRNALRADGM